MYTELGRWLKVFRLSRGLRLYDMAEKLECSSAFLSAIENGKKAAPVSFFDNMKNKYGLDKKESNELKEAIEKTRAETKKKAETIHLKIDNLKQWTDQLAFVFARKVNNLNEQQRKELLKILENES